MYGIAFCKQMSDERKEWNTKKGLFCNIFSVFEWFYFLCGWLWAVLLQKEELKKGTLNEKKINERKESDEVDIYIIK